MKSSLITGIICLSILVTKAQNPTAPVVNPSVNKNTNNGSNNVNSSNSGVNPAGNPATIISTPTHGKSNLNEINNTPPPRLNSSGENVVNNAAPNPLPATVQTNQRPVNSTVQNSDSLRINSPSISVSDSLKKNKRQGIPMN